MGQQWPRRSGCLFETRRPFAHPHLEVVLADPTSSPSHRSALLARAVRLSLPRLSALSRRTRTPGTPGEYSEGILVGQMRHRLLSDGSNQVSRDHARWSRFLWRSAVLRATSGCLGGRGEHLRPRSMTGPVMVERHADAPMCCARASEAFKLSEPGFTAGQRPRQRPRQRPLPCGRCCFGSERAPIVDPPAMRVGVLSVEPGLDELDRGEPAVRRCGPVHVVVDPPVFSEDLGLERRSNWAVQVLVAYPAVEAFDPGVLPGAAGSMNTVSVPLKRHQSATA